MNENDFPFVDYQLKLETEIKEIFGIDVREQVPVLRKTRFELEEPNFVEIPNLTRKIQIGVQSVKPMSLNQNVVEKPVWVNLFVGWSRPVYNPERLVFRCERSPGTAAWSLYNDWSDSFFKRGYDELLLLLNRMKTDSGNFLAIANLVSTLSPLNKGQQLSEREVAVVSDFINQYFILKVSTLTECFRIQHVSTRSRFSSPEHKIGYVPKSWTLKEFAKWLLVSDRFPTLKEAKQIQAKIHKRNDGIQDLKERD